MWINDRAVILMVKSLMHNGRMSFSEYVLWKIHSYYHIKFYHNISKINHFIAILV